LHTTISCILFLFLPFHYPRSMYHILSKTRCTRMQDAPQILKLNLKKKEKKLNCKTHPKFFKLPEFKWPNQNHFFFFKLPEHTRVKGAFEFSARRVPRNLFPPLIYKILRWFNELKIWRHLSVKGAFEFSARAFLYLFEIRLGTSWKFKGASYKRRLRISARVFLYQSNFEWVNRNLLASSSTSYKIRRRLLHKAPSIFLKKFDFGRIRSNARHTRIQDAPLIFGCGKWKNCVLYSSEYGKNYVFHILEFCQSDYIITGLCH